MATNCNAELRILQTNVGRKRLSHDLELASAAEGRYDLLVVAEPNPTLVRNRGWFVDDAGVVGVHICNRKLRVYGIDAHMGYISVRMERLNLVCCYISPNIVVGEYENRLNAIMEEVRRLGNECVVLGNFNAKSAEWGSPITNTRGKMLLEWIGALDLVILNTGLEPTFVRGDSRLYIDVTLTTQGTARCVKDWAVLVEYTGTEHQFIGFSIGKTEDVGGRPKPCLSICRRYHVDWGVYDESIRWKVHGARRLTPSVEGLEQVMKAAMHMSKIGTERTGRMPYWWYVEIEQLKRECVALRRHLTRARIRLSAEEVERVDTSYRARKKELNRRIRAEKRH
ncbi:uncharacterized protein [Diabrotica undecimpunctata]|uniref:uncharacterized protein n=1 Tax=Diabrotica undecimpunctata TaxID=50387 RepID=UPI003B6418AD